LGLVVLLAISAWEAAAQSPVVQVSRDNRTISVSVQYTLVVDPEVTVLRFGYVNSSPDKDTAFRENVRMANQIIAALNRAGIPSRDISTNSLTLEKQEEYRPSEKAQPLFKSQQQWTLRVDAKEAQKIIDLVVRAGANDINDPEWTVKDPLALEAKANATALARAKEVAQQIASGLNAHLGDLVHANNGTVGRFGNVNMSTETIEVNAASVVETTLKVFPKKVERAVNVNAVFLIQ